MSNTNTEVLTTAYEKLQGAITQSNTVLPKLEEAVKNADLSNYATVSDLEDMTNKIGSRLNIAMFPKLNVETDDSGRFSRVIQYINNNKNVSILELNAESYTLSQTFSITTRNFRIEGIGYGRNTDNSNNYGIGSEILSTVDGALFKLTGTDMCFKNIRTKYIGDKTSSLNNKTALSYNRNLYGTNSKFLELYGCHNLTCENLIIENYYIGIDNSYDSVSVVNDFAIFKNVNYQYCKIGINTYAMSQGSFYDGQYLCCDTGIICGGVQRFVNSNIVKCGSESDIPVVVKRSGVVFDNPWFEDQNNSDRIVESFIKINSQKENLGYIQSFKINNGHLVIGEYTNYFASFGKSVGIDIQLTANGTATKPIKKLFNITYGENNIYLDIKSSWYNDSLLYDNISTVPKIAVKHFNTNYISPSISLGGQINFNNSTSNECICRISNDVVLTGSSNIIADNIVSDYSSSYDSTTGLYTNKIKGFYLIGLQIKLSGDFTYCRVGFKENGSGTFYECFGESNRSGNVISGTIFKRINKNATLQLAVETDGTSITINKNCFELRFIKLPYLPSY